MTGCVVLSAGASSRMGSPKALCTREGRTFLETIVDCARASGVESIVVVLGAPHAEAIRPRVPSGASVALNPHPERGMLSSVQAGISSLPPVDHALLWPVDVPAVRAETVRAISSAAPGQIVVPTFDGRGGHPLRVPRACFDELLALDPALGLRALIQAEPARVLRLPVDDPHVLVDVDTPDDLRRLKP
jgi:molybdenum cofactor cytidylyltransferase